MSTRGTIAKGEWYHCYNRGVDKRKIFLNKGDYERFVMLLYVANSQTRIHLSNLGQPPRQGPTLSEVLQIERGVPLVEIGALSLMPNHFHLLIRPLDFLNAGIFMQKVATGYSMYFNKKYERAGALFQGKFKSKHIDSDEYFRRLFNYIHGNVAELYEPGWKGGKIANEKNLLQKLSAYPFSSLPSYLDRGDKTLDAVINKDAVLDVLEKMPTLKDIVEEARIFAQEERQGRTLP